MSKSFKVDDVVTWRSQAAGSWKTKTGTVIEVVAAHKIPRDKNFGSSRNHESYIVEVTYEPQRSTSAIKSMRVKKPERYWPRVSNLRLAYGKPLAEILMEDLKTDHLPIQVIEHAPDAQWKDIAGSNAESTN